VTSSACRGRLLVGVLAEHDPAALTLGRILILIAYGALLYVTPELWHFPERPANFLLLDPSFHISAFFVRVDTWSIPEMVESALGRGRLFL
jgi:hypothetical protein